MIHRRTTSRADRSKRTSIHRGSLTRVRLSLRLFVRTVWLEKSPKIALKKQQRESEGEDAEAAIAEA